MKVEINGDEVRIMGDEFGDEKHIKIHCSSQPGEDYYSISLIKGGMEYGCFPSITITRRDVICQNNMDRGRNIIDF